MYMYSANPTHKKVHLQGIKSLHSNWIQAQIPKLPHLLTQSNKWQNFVTKSVNVCCLFMAINNTQHATTIWTTSIHIINTTR